MVGDLGEDPCEPGLRIDVVELSGLDKCEGDRHSFATTFWTRKHPVFPAEGDGFDGEFGLAVIQFQVAIFQVTPRFWHPAKPIADGLGQW